MHVSTDQFLSTPSARRATQEIYAQGTKVDISIHALREEGDPGTIRRYLRQSISIHALREEGDPPVERKAASGASFLSTPSARRATGGVLSFDGTKSEFLSTPSARRATDGVLLTELVEIEFLSTPSARRATRYAARIAGSAKFLSTPSARRATRGMRRGSPDLRNFYPRPPRGGRPNRFFFHRCSFQFLSTPSARRATCCRWGSSPGCVYFYPRPPRGGRRLAPVKHRLNKGISIHALREEGDFSPRRAR